MVPKKQRPSKNGKGLTHREKFIGKRKGGGDVELVYSETVKDGPLREVGGWGKG